jgi:hypothetical protein
MDAVRSRRAFRIAPGMPVPLVPIIEWLLAAGFLSCLIVVGGVIVHELRAVPRPPRSEPVARVLSTSVPAAIPSRAVSVPVLPFHNGKEVKVGDSVSAVATSLGRAAEVGRQEIDRGSLGERLTRFYEYGGARFILVFEPFEQNGEARLAAIYLP